MEGEVTLSASDLVLIFFGLKNGCSENQNWVNIRSSTGSKRDLCNIEIVQKIISKNLSYFNSILLIPNQFQQA